MCSNTGFRFECVRLRCKGWARMTTSILQKCLGRIHLVAGPPFTALPGDKFGVTLGQDFELVVDGGDAWC